MPKRIRVTLGIGMQGRQEDDIEISDEEWDGCETDEQRDGLMNSYWSDWSSNYIDGGSELLEDEA